MNLAIDHAQGVAIVRVHEPKLIYPMLSDFARSVTDLLARGDTRIVIDLSEVIYIDSASIGCLMDLHRQAHQAEGTVKLSGVQKRVETMLTMTGTLNFIELHHDESAAVSSFGE